MFWIGVVCALIGVFLWARTVTSFLAFPGYRSFDMTTASVFDAGWAKGALFLAIGAGLASHSLPVGVATGVVGFLSTMLVKPLLLRVTAGPRKRNPRAPEDR